MSNFQKDKKYSDIFIPCIQEGLVIAGVAKDVKDISIANDKEDMLHNTDLMVGDSDDLTILAVGQKRIACRIRKNKYLDMVVSNIDGSPRILANDFTIRVERPRRPTTEIHKIYENWGHTIFYGFANASDTGLQAWAVLDMDVFRWYTLLMRHVKMTKEEFDIFAQRKTNYDKSSSFRGFNMTLYPSNLIIFRAKKDERNLLLPNVEKVDPFKDCNW